MTILKASKTIKAILPEIYPLTNYSLILADGQFPTDNYLHQIMCRAQHIICCDGAVDKLLDYNKSQTSDLQLQPYLIIGDLDGISVEARTQFHDQIIYVPEQDCNDLTKALNHCQSLEFANLVILGATGLREDHTIANIALLASHCHQFNQLCIVSEFGIFTAHINHSIIRTIPGQQLSFFTLNPSTVINALELKWPLINRCFTSWNQATLNQALDYKVNLITNDVVIVYRAFSLKAR